MWLAIGGVVVVIALAGLALWITKTKGALGEQNKSLQRGMESHLEMERIMAQPIPRGDNLRTRMRARLKRLQNRLG